MNGYKCYLLCEKHNAVYGVITENKKGVGFHQMRLNSDGKLEAITPKHPSWAAKRQMENWQCQSTLIESEVIQFIQQKQELRKIKLL